MEQNSSFSDTYQLSLSSQKPSYCYLVMTFRLTGFAQFNLFTLRIKVVLV